MAVTPQLKGRDTVLEPCMLLTMVPAVSFVTILELALVDRGAHWPGRASDGEAGGQADLSAGREGGEERLDDAGVRMARAVAGRSVVSAVTRDSVPGFRGWASSQPSAAGPAAAGPAAGRTRECVVFEISSRWLSSPGGCVR